MTKGLTIWLTGYSGAGKTTIAEALKARLMQDNYPCEVLDGDVVRTNLSKGLTFSKADRIENIVRIGFVASLLTKHGVIVIVSAISPYREGREAVKKNIANFVEVYINCPLAICEKRDVKGLYKKARAGEIKNFTGVNDPYEEPLNSDVTCHTHTETVSDSVNKILKFVNDQYLAIK